MFNLKNDPFFASLFKPDTRADEQKEIDRKESEERERQRSEQRQRERLEYLSKCPRYDLGGGEHGWSHHLLGRCANGSERDSGRLFHIIAENGGVLCGAKEGQRRSNGWSDVMENKASCPRCLKRLAKMQSI